VDKFMTVNQMVSGSSPDSGA